MPDRPVPRPGLISTAPIVVHRTQETGNEGAR